MGLPTLNGLIVDQGLSDGRYFVFADQHGPHRILVRHGHHGGALSYVVQRDELAPVRLAVAARLERRLTGLSAGPLPPVLKPTAFQRRRLTLLVNLLEAALARVSRREMAMVLIYPKMKALRSAEWEASGERRRTQRLVSQALALMEGGYRALLHGAPSRRRTGTVSPALI